MPNRTNGSAALISASGTATSLSFTDHATPLEVSRPDPELLRALRILRTALEQRECRPSGDPIEWDANLPVTRADCPACWNALEVLPGSAELFVRCEGGCRPHSVLLELESTFCDSDGSDFAHLCRNVTGGVTALSILQYRQEEQKRQERAARLSRSGLVSAASLQARGDAESVLVPGWFSLDSLAVVWGAPASLKSFGVQGLAASIAAGIPWHGLPVTKGPVLYIVGEGSVACPIGSTHSGGTTVYLRPTCRTCIFRPAVSTCLTATR